MEIIFLRKEVNSLCLTSEHTIKRQRVTQERIVAQKEAKITHLIDRLISILSVKNNKKELYRNLKLFSKEIRSIDLRITIYSLMQLDRSRKVQIEGQEDRWMIQ